MRTIRSDARLDWTRIGALTLVLAALQPGAAYSQVAVSNAPAPVREVVSSEVAVSNDEAALHLEFADDGDLRISFREGRVLVDDEDVGSFQRGGSLDAAWRGLLGRAVSLDDGPLAEALRDWEPPAGLAGSAAEIARRVDGALEEALAAPATVQEDEAEPVTVQADPAEGAQERLLRALVSRPGGIGLVSQALEGLSLDAMTLRVAQDVSVDPGTRVESTLVVVDGNVEVAGEVGGSLVVVNGDLRLREGSRVTGDIRLANARLFREGGVVEGRVRTVDVGDAEGRASVDVDAVRADVERELARELREEIRSEIRQEFRGGSIFSPLRHIMGGIGGLIQNAITFAILAAIGLAVMYFARENLEVVAETARVETARSAVVGVAGAFLVFPVWLLGMVALLVSIIGIPVAIAWIPLFPLAVALAGGLGFMAVALQVGEWVAERDFQGLEWIRSSNPFYTLLAGIGAFILAFAAANVAQMAGPWLSFLQGLLTAVGTLATMAALVIGFGAVLLTRGGRRPTYAGADVEFGSSPWDRESTPYSEPSEGPWSRQDAFDRDEDDQAEGLEDEENDARRASESGGADDGTHKAG